MNCEQDTFHFSLFYRQTSTHSPPGETVILFYHIVWYLDIDFISNLEVCSCWYHWICNWKSYPTFLHLDLSKKKCFCWKYISTYSRLVVVFTSGNQFRDQWFCVLLNHGANTLSILVRWDLNKVRGQVRFLESKISRCRPQCSHVEEQWHISSKSSVFGSAVLWKGRQFSNNFARCRISWNCCVFASWLTLISS